jgi:hypothetical protein
VSDETTSTTTNSNFTTKLTLSTGSIPAGIYRIGWYYEVGNDTVDGDVGARVQLNITQTLTETSATALNATDFYSNGGYRYVALSAGTHTVQIQYKRGAAGLGTASIRRARLEIWELQ